MVKKVALLTLHGMGSKQENYHEELTAGLSDRMGASAWSEVHVESIFYSDVFQNAQNELFRRVEGKVGSKRLRRFLLYGFADAGGLEHSRHLKDSAYTKVQERIFAALGTAYAAMANQSAPIVIVAQSLGCQVISSYIWDAQRHTKKPPGIWRLKHSGLSAPELKFRKCATLRLLVTTGCNIPVFVGGLPPEEIKPIKKPNSKFVWENYYDEDDALGWPLQDLNGAYNALVRDYQINAGGIMTSWNPFSHGQYWGDRDVQEPLARHLLSLLGRA
jgi:hypothetical protein